jgi:hypothetical protein
MFIHETQFGQGSAFGIATAIDTGLLSHNLKDLITIHYNNNLFSTGRCNLFNLTPRWGFDN